MARRKAREILEAGQAGSGFKRLERRSDASKEGLGFVKFCGPK